MGGGPRLFEGAHLNSGIRALVANQANVAITRFLGGNMPPEFFGFDSCAPFKE